MFLLILVTGHMAWRQQCCATLNLITEMVVSENQLPQSPTVNGNYGHVHYYSLKGLFGGILHFHTHTHTPTDPFKSSTEIAATNAISWAMSPVNKNSATPGSDTGRKNPENQVPTGFPTKFRVPSGISGGPTCLEKPLVTKSVVAAGIKFLPFSTVEFHILAIHLGKPR